MAHRTNSIAALTALMLAAGGFTFQACGPQQQAEEMEERVDEKLEDLAEGKRGMSHDLIKLRNDIDVKHAKAEAELLRTDLTPEERAKQEALKTELSEQRDRVERALGQVEGATPDTWETIKADAKRTTDDVAAWFERQAEKIDRETTRDNDQDGH